MKEIMEKLSSYNLFNYLFPGVLFAYLLSKFTNVRILQDDLLVGAFLYYFLGVVVSRFGSLIVEPILKRFKFVQFQDYASFVTASAVDQKLELFSEVNNTYRTLISLFVLLPLVILYEALSVRVPLLADSTSGILIALLFLMFLFSYRKQSSYISKRIQRVGEKP